MTTNSPAEAVAVRTWARSFVESSAEREPLAIVESIVSAVAAAIGRGPLHAPSSAAPATVDEPPGGWCNVWLPGIVHEQAVSAEARTARGAWYTPESVVRGLIDLATADRVVPELAADPTCGGGAFLVAALDRLVDLGVGPAEAVGRVAGLDIDAGAAQVSRWSIGLWAAANGVSVPEADIDVSVGDALSAYPSHWSSAALLVGNPPFATPLRTGAVPADVAGFRVGREELLGPYTDLAAMHLLGAVEKSTAGSVVALVQPQSVLAGRDSQPLREHCDAVAPIHGLWAAREPPFDAGVRACAVVLKPGRPAPGEV
ncbi:MAG: N-6 DNA methylase, partial [Acidimicrobiales bacterium]